MRSGIKAHTMLIAITKQILRTSISQNIFSVWTKFILRKHQKHSDCDSKTKSYQIQ